MTDRDEIHLRVKQVLVSTLQIDVDPEDLPDDEVLFGEGLGASSIATLETLRQGAGRRRHDRSR